MCTLTYLPLKNNNFILTSNRDETPMRKTIPPKKYIEDGVELIYPKDEFAGGTWIGTSNKKRLVCLLNGGFKSHKRKDNYKMSRGIIVKNILTSTNSVNFINTFNFMDIEPFTLILICWENNLEMYELVWDGTQKHFKKLPQEPTIWSSSSLYTDEMKSLRENWFANWLQENHNFTQENILEFHENENLGTQETAPKMKRNFVETVSITSIKKNNGTLNFTYFDVLKDTVEVLEIK